ncbi:MAG TPA: L-threonylcarbamoyladenylate synthase [Coleofasciculaceae cyanobacterium]|jgi:L-threonylcarbamoyladenylate synthase
MVQVSQADLITGAIAGKVVSFPTDTVPALAVKPESAKQIYQLKQRSHDKPLILLGASIQDLLPYVVYTRSELTAWQSLIGQYLPGALTLVLPASAKVPAAVNPTESNTVGIRIPNHPIALNILQQTGVLATSSANISGQNTLMTMEAIERAFPDILVLDWLDSSASGALASGLPSTVVCWQNQGWQILRQGSVTI